MAKFTLREQADLEDLFEMGSGYVLDFSNNTFRKFIAQAIDIDADDSKYSEDNSGSKANRLRAIWELASDATVSRLLDALIDHRGHRPEIILPPGLDTWHDVEGPDPKADLIERCRDIARRLSGEPEDRSIAPSHENSMTTPTATIPNSVFVVHGRDSAVQKDLFKFLRVIGLQPTIFDRARSPGSEMNFDIVRTGMESAAAVLLLLTPEEASYLRDDLRFPGEDGHVWHPRPNVIFEAGWALGAHQGKTTIVEAGFTHSISDMHGFNTVRMSGGQHALNDLVHRLKLLGLQPDTTDSAWMVAEEYPNLLSVAAPTMPTIAFATRKEKSHPEYDDETLVRLLQRVFQHPAGFVLHTELDELARVPSGTSARLGERAASEAGRLVSATSGGIELNEYMPVVVSTKRVRR